nr:hypothetical protein [Halomonas elongata]
MTDESLLSILRPCVDGGHGFVQALGHDTPWQWRSGEMAVVERIVIDFGAMDGVAPIVLPPVGVNMLPARASGVPMFMGTSLLRLPVLDERSGGFPDLQEGLFQPVPARVEIDPALGIGQIHRPQVFVGAWERQPTFTLSWVRGRIRESGSMRAARRIGRALGNERFSKGYGSTAIPGSYCIPPNGLAVSDSLSPVNRPKSGHASDVTSPEFSALDFQRSIKTLFANAVL